MPSSLVWHYSTGAGFRRIINSGRLQPATQFVDPPEKPILWFSSNQTWEPTANKLLVNPDGTASRSASKEETRELCGGLVRFGCRINRLHAWPEIASQAEMPDAVAQSLEKLALDAGSNPNDWYGTTEPIRLDEIESIEIEAGGSWISVTP